MELPDLPRPGFWLGHDPEIELCDGRLFTQRQTDLLIEAQLWNHFDWAVDSDADAARIDILGDWWPRGGALCSPVYLIEFPADAGYIYRPWGPGEPNLRPTTQRAGIHTRAAVRWMARAAWGDRDLRWIKPAVDDTLLRRFAAAMEVDVAYALAMTQETPANGDGALVRKVTERIEEVARRRRLTVAG